MSETEKSISIGAQELKELLTAVVQEAKKPAPPTAAQLKQQAEEQENRRIMGEQQRDVIAAKQTQQRICTHIRPASGMVGGSRSVFVQDDLGGYMLCQKCQARVRPNLSEEHRKRDTVGIIYNTDLFNRLLQETQSSNFA